MNKFLNRADTGQSTLENSPEGRISRWIAVRDRRPSAGSGHWACAEIRLLMVRLQREGGVRPNQSCRDIPANYSRK